jgi:subtilase family serine protease
MKYPAPRRAPVEESMQNRIATLSNSLLALTVVLLCAVGTAKAQGVMKESYFIPDSSLERAGDNGIRVHTHYVISLRPATATVGRPYGLSPDNLRAVYNLPLTKNLVAGVNGGSGTIAIVDAYDYPTATADFNKFSAEFGLPLASHNVCNGAHPCFRVVYASGAKPAANCDWGMEAALDIEWAHAMAPYAEIVLVEAANNTFQAMMDAVNVAANEVTCGKTSCSGETSGAGEVSMSWGGSEFSGETSYDSFFKKSGVVYVASTGDTGGHVTYPSSSPDVVAAGGSTLNFTHTSSDYVFASETAWSDGGGGKSVHETRPAYQNGISLVGAARGVPDLAFDANPDSGVIIYDGDACGGLADWFNIGGTSVAAPSLAGVINSTAHFYASSTLQLESIYSFYNTKSKYEVDYRDITVGKAGGYSAGPGWDFATGVGSPLTYTGK